MVTLDEHEMTSNSSERCLKPGGVRRDTPVLVTPQVERKSLLWGLLESGRRMVSFRQGWEILEMNWRDYVSVDPTVMHGAACIAGTRIPVAVVLDNLAARIPEERLLAEYPSLTPVAIEAALAYAAELAREETFLLHG